MGTIVLVRAEPDAGNGTAGDLALQARLEAAGHTVVRVADEEAEYAGSYDGVVVSDSCSGGTVGNKYDTVAKPGITLENVTWRLGSYLGGITGTNWTVEDVDGNGGLTGDQTIYTEALSQQGIDTDTLPGTPTVVARLTGDADHGVYVTWPAGSVLTSGTAPGKRVFLRIGDAAIPVLTAAGTALLDAAIEWAFGSGATITGTASVTLGALDVAATGRRIGPVSESGTVADVVAEVYANRINGNGDETYVVPTSGEAADLAAAFAEIMAGDHQAAAVLVDPYGYDVVELADTATGRDHVFLRERTPCTRFWGFYLASLDPARTGMVVEAPHPKADLHTHTEAASLFDKANARAFLLSTVHRESNVATDGEGNKVGDLANYTGVNPLQSVHEVVATAGTTVVQIHGYGNSTEPDYDIVVSEGQPSPALRTQNLGQDLRETPGAFRVAVYDGVVGTALGATGNVQGQQSRAAGVYWVHVEQNSTVRTSATLRAEVEDVLALGIPGAVTGTASVTLGGLDVVALGTVIPEVVPGAATVALGALDVSAAGTRTTSGSAAVTLGTVSVAAQGTVVPEVVTGAVSVALGALSVAASGTRTMSGTAEVTLGALQVSAVGEGAAPVVTGEAEFVLGGVEVTANGVRTTAGTAAVTLGALDVVAVGDVTGVVVVDGEAAVALGALVLAATGKALDPWGRLSVRLMAGTPIVHRGLSAGTPVQTSGPPTH